jgi:hypothetical protein
VIELKQPHELVRLLPLQGRDILLDLRELPPQSNQPFDARKFVVAT